MKNHFLLATLLAALALIALPGCGGTGDKTVTTDAALTRSAIQDSLKSGNSARIARQGQMPSTSREENGIIRYEIGDPYDVGSPYFGRITGFDTYEFEGTEKIGTLNYDIFAEPEFTTLVGSSKFSSVETDTLFETLAETEFNDKANSPSRSRSFYRLDKAAGTTLFSFLKAGRITDQPGEPFDEEVTTEFTSESASKTGTYSFTQKRNGALKNQASGRYLGDGGYESSWTNDRGYTVTMKFAADASGSFTVTNPNDPLCPAEGQFDTNGIGTVTFADGTTAEFNLYQEQFWQD